MLFLESSLALCFIHTLQLEIKSLLFSENNISVLIAKALLAILINLLQRARS